MRQLRRQKNERECISYPTGDAGSILKLDDNSTVSIFVKRRMSSDSELEPSVYIKTIDLATQSTIVDVDIL